MEGVASSSANPILKNRKLISINRPTIEAATPKEFLTFHWNLSSSSFADTSDNIVSESPWDVMQYTSTFCPTPFSLGLPRYLVLNLDSLTIAS